MFENSQQIGAFKSDINPSNKQTDLPLLLNQHNFAMDYINENIIISAMDAYMAYIDKENIY